MTEITVRVLDESEWSVYRDVRLRALAESPGSFTATLAEEADRDEQFWRDRMTQSHRLLAERGPVPQGIVSLGPYEQEPSAAEVFSGRRTGGTRYWSLLATRRGGGGSGGPAGLPAALLLGGDRQRASGRFR